MICHVEQIEELINRLPMLKSVDETQLRELQEVVRYAKDTPQIVVCISADYGVDEDDPDWNCVDINGKQIVWYSHEIGNARINALESGIKTATALGIGMSVHIFDPGQRSEPGYDETRHFGYHDLPEVIAWYNSVVSYITEHPLEHLLKVDEQHIDAESQETLKEDENEN